MWYCTGVPGRSIDDGTGRTITGGHMKMVPTEEEEDPASASVSASASGSRAGSLGDGHPEQHVSASASASAVHSASSPSTSGLPASVRKERKSLSDAFFGGAREEILARSISVSQHVISSSSPSKRGSLRRAGSGANRSNRRAYRRNVAANDNNNNNNNNHTEPSASDAPTTPSSRRSSRTTTNTTIGSSRSLLLDSSSRHTPTTPRRSLHKNSISISVSNHVARKRTTVAPFPALVDDNDDDTSVMTWTRETPTTKAKSSSDLPSKSSHRSSHRRASAIHLLGNNSSEHSRSNSRIKTRGRDTEVGTTPLRVRSRSRSSRPRHRSTTNLGGGTGLVALNNNKGQDADGVIASESNLFSSPKNSPETSSAHSQLPRQRKSDKIPVDSAMAPTTSPSGPRRSREFLPDAVDPLQDGSPSPRQTTMEQIDSLVTGVPAEPEAESRAGAETAATAATAAQPPVTPGTRRRHRETAPYALAPLNDEPRESSSFRVCRRTKSHDVNTTAGAGMEHPQPSPGSSRRRHRSKSRDAPPIHAPFHEDQQLNSQDEGHAAATQTASPGTRKQYRSKNRDIAALLPQGNENEGHFIDGGSSSLAEIRNSSTPTNPRRRIKSSQLQPPAALDLFATTDTIQMVSPLASLLSRQEAACEVEDFFATTPSSSRLILEEADADADRPSVGTTQQQPQQMMTPARLKGFKHFLGSTTIIKKFHKGGHSPSIDDVMSRVAEIPKPIVVHPVEMLAPAPAPAPLHEHQPLVPGRKRNELIRDVFSPETRSRRGQQQHALTSKLMGNRVTTNGASQLLSARRGGLSSGTFQSFDDSGVISTYLDVLHGDDCSIEQASPYHRKTDNSRQVSPTRLHQKSNSITDTSLPSSFGSTLNTTDTPSDSAAFAESNQAVRELESVLSKPLWQEGLPNVTKTHLQDLFNIDDAKGLGCTSMTRDSFFGYQVAECPVSLLEDDKATATTNKTKEDAFRIRSDTQLDLSQHSLMTLEEQKQFLQLNIPGISGSSASTLVVTQHDVLVFQEVPTTTPEGAL